MTASDAWSLVAVPATKQRWEYGRFRPNVLNFSSVQHVGGERFEASWDREKESGPSRWTILAESRIVRALNWPPDMP